MKAVPKDKKLRRKLGAGFTEHAWFQARDPSTKPGCSWQCMWKCRRLTKGTEMCHKCKYSQSKVFFSWHLAGMARFYIYCTIYKNISLRSMNFRERSFTVFFPNIFILSFSVERIQEWCLPTVSHEPGIYPSASHLWTLSFGKSNSGMESLVDSSQPATLQESTKSPTYMSGIDTQREKMVSSLQKSELELGRQGVNEWLPWINALGCYRNPDFGTAWESQNTRTGFQCRIWPAIPSKVLRSKLGPELGCECPGRNRNNLDVRSRS